MTATLSEQDVQNTWGFW